MFGAGPLELFIVAFILLLMFGAKRLPELGRSLGSGMREFKEGIMNPGEDVKEELTSSTPEQKRHPERTVSALSRPTEAKTRSAPEMRDAVPTERLTPSDSDRDGV